MRCSYEPTGETRSSEIFGTEYEYECSACGYIQWSNHSKEYVFRDCIKDGVYAVARDTINNPCIYLGKYTRLVKCSSCLGNVQLKVFGCELHEECTLDTKLKKIESCKSCKDYETIQPEAIELEIVEDSDAVSKLNLLYHITPVAANDVWQENVRQLLHRIHIFNGKKVIGISRQSPHDKPEFVLDDPSVVIKAFDGYNCEFIIREHVEKYREVVTLLPLLDTVNNVDPSHATFYAHAKGVTRYGTPLQAAVEYHRNMMYHELLDDIYTVKKLLNNYSMVGTTRINHPGGNPAWRRRLSLSKWHFSGTFYWFHNRDLFSIARWKQMLSMRKHGWLAEAMPGILFPYERGYCIAYDNPADVYDASTYNPQIKDSDALPDLTMQVSDKD